MLKGLKYFGCILLAAGILAGCQEKTIIPDGEDTYTGCIPRHPDKLPGLYLSLPEDTTLGDVRKKSWTKDVSVRIQATVDGTETTVFEVEGAKLKAHGNTTLTYYPKKPLTLKLDKKADLIGTGKTKRWVLLANWMDRTLLRNDLAFELARHTALEWTPSGTFVDLYVNGEHQGIYWMGELIHVEDSHFTCDYFYSYDTSDEDERDFDTMYGHWENATKIGGIPVELKYPDRDDYSPEEFQSILLNAKNTLYAFEEAIMRGENPSSVMDMNTLCDYYLVQELCGNGENRFPKSTFLYARDNKLYWGPVWDFDYGSFTPDYHGLGLKSSLYYYQIWSHPEFRKHLKHRWSLLKPEFQKVAASYIDSRAAFIRESETVNHQMWPCFPNPMAETPDGMVNGDEQMTFDQAIARLKKTLTDRIYEMDLEINRL